MTAFYPFLAERIKIYTNVSHGKKKDPKQMYEFPLDNDIKLIVELK